MGPWSLDMNEAYYLAMLLADMTVAPLVSAIFSPKTQRLF